MDVKFKASSPMGSRFNLISKHNVKKTPAEVLLSSILFRHSSICVNLIVELQVSY